MIRAFYSAGAGMQAQQLGMDIRSNNISNIQTTGYKKSSVEFSDLTYSVFREPGDQRSGVQLGMGVKVSGSNRSFSQGTLVKTDSPTDLAINGTGFFALRGSDGQVFYTRDGSFRLSVEPDSRYLVSPQGEYLLDTNGSRIAIPYGITEIEVQADGSILNAGPDVRVGLFSFANPKGLEAAGNNRYRITVASGEAVLDYSGEILQNYLESSNVDLIDEITALIRTQRAFQLASRVVQTADDMESIANNLST